MIVADIKMWPKGDTGNAYDLGRIEIINIGGTIDIGDYEVKLYKSASHGAKKSGIWRSGRVRGFPRRRLGNYDLIFRALAVCCGSRSPLVVAPETVGSREDIGSGGYVRFTDHCAVLARVEAERDHALARLEEAGIAIIDEAVA